MNPIVAAKAFLNQSTLITTFQIVKMGPESLRLEVITIVTISLNQILDPK